MSKLIYVDTNIYLDYLENRSDKMRPLGEFAYSVFRRALGCEFSVAISDHVTGELHKFVSEERAGHIMGKLKEANKAELVTVLDSDRESARTISGLRKTSYSDTLHAILAQRTGAVVIVTRNLKDFEALSDLVEAILPEYL